MDIKSLLSVMCVAVPLAASAQSVDVNTVNYRATRGAYRQGEVIVKFKTSSKVAMQAPSRTAFRSSQVSEVDRVFNEIGVKEVSELMPLTGSRTYSAAAKSINGKPIEAQPMEQSYLLTLNDEAANVYEAVERLCSVADVEYAEPNYLVYALEDSHSTPPTTTHKLLTTLIMNCNMA